MNVIFGCSGLDQSKRGGQDCLDTLGGPRSLSPWGFGNLDLGAGGVWSVVTARVNGGRLIFNGFFHFHLALLNLQRWAIRQWLHCRVSML